jgi:phage gp46-like protein
MRRTKDTARRDEALQKLIDDQIAMKIKVASYSIEDKVSNNECSAK